MATVAKQCISTYSCFSDHSTLLSSLRALSICLDWPARENWFCQVQMERQWPVYEITRVTWRVCVGNCVSFENKQTWRMCCLSWLFASFFGAVKRKWRWKMKLKRTSYFSLVSTLFRSDPYHYTVGDIESLSDRAPSLFLSHFPRGEIGLLFFLNRYKQFGVIWCPCNQ